MNYNTLKTSVANVIKENGNNEITGNLLQQTLIAMINSLGAGYQFMGVAKPSTNPGAPDQRVFYIAAQPGTYPNFNAEVTLGEIAILYYSTTWLKDSITAVDLTEMGFKGTFQSGIGLDPSDGEIIVDVSYYASDYIPVNNGYVVIYSGGETDSNRAAIVGYDEDKYMVSVLLSGGQDRVNEIVTINDPDIKYIRVSSCNQNHENYATPFAYNVIATTDVLVKVQELREDTDILLERLSYIQPIINVIRDGYIFRGIGIPTQQYLEDATDTFYWIETPGTYPGGVLATGEVGLLMWDGSDWTIEKLNIATKTALAATNEALGTLSETVSGIASVVVQILSVVAAGYEFIGEVTPASVFPADTYRFKVMFLAQTPGSYNNHGRFAIADDEIALLCYDPASEEWSKIALDVAKKSVINAALAEVKETYAKQNGEYPEMKVGEATAVDNVPAVVEQSPIFTFRRNPFTNAGHALKIKEIKGNSIVWNQQLQNGNFADTTGWSASGGSISASGNILTISADSDGNVGVSKDIALISGHKYLMLISVSGYTGATLTLRQYVNGAFADYVSGASLTTYYQRLGGIITAPTGTGGNNRILIAVNGMTAGNPAYVRDAIIIDLTAMFGAGNEPTTVAEFQALYPGFHDYNAGEIKNLMATGIKTTGFNQWDEEWEAGRYNLQDGSKQTSPSGVSDLRSTNAIRVFPATEYSITRPERKDVRIMQYDADGNYIGYLSPESTGDYAVFTTAANAVYIRFCEYLTTTYNHDICINLSWSGYRDGEYEPYEEHTLALPLTTLKGKLDGEGESEVIFPNGMCGVGTAHDTLNGKTAVKRFGVVDMGELEWSRSSSSGIFYANTPLIVKGGGKGLITKYVWVSTTRLYTASESDSGIFALGYIYTQSGINIRDNSYTDAATFKAAMSGVMLIYELATPIEYTLDEPLSLLAKSDPLGTQMLLPPQTGMSEPTSAPMLAVIEYYVNALKGVVKVGTLTNLLESLKTAGTISAYTMTWNDATGEYDFTITV